MVKASLSPSAREKDGGVKGTLINLTQLSRLQKKMDGILTEMGESYIGAKLALCQALEQDTTACATGATIKACADMSRARLCGPLKS